MRVATLGTEEVRWAIEPRGAARGMWRERVAIVVGVRGDGATGLGEAAPLPGMSVDSIEDARRGIEALRARLPVAIDGPEDAFALAAEVAEAPAARFAIEAALLSALAQRGGTSVAQLLAPRPAAALRVAIVVDDEDEARAAVRAGARCLKLKVGDDLARVHRIAAAAPDARLRLDANRGWPRAEVLARLAAVRDLPIDFVEEPCQRAHELLDDAPPVRLALDESLGALAPAELERALRSPQLAALVLKPTLLGGFARCLALAAAANRHGVAPVVSHALEGPIGFAACWELGRAIGADVPAGLGRASGFGHVDRGFRLRASGEGARA